MKSYLDNLNQEQLACVYHHGSNLLVHAGAGSGKTRVVIARIIHHILEQNIPPYKILAVTFTNRAVREMRERLAAGFITDGLSAEQSQQVLIRTFHAFGAWLLRRNAQAAGLVPNFTIYDDDDSQALLKQAWPSCRNRAKQLQRLIAKAKDCGLGYYQKDSEDLKEQLERFSSEPDFYEAFCLYQQALQRIGNADFADLLGLSVQLLEQDSHLQAQAQSQVQQRFCRILVDEYQDSNPLQDRLLHLLLGRKGQELCIVGDEDQSIYGFRGAQVSHILEFHKNFAPAKILKLEQNYRSCAPILELANQVIQHNHKRLGKILRPTKSGGSLPQFHLFASCEDEAVFIAQRIRQKPQHTAILYRTNAQSRTFERVLRQWNIPYKLVGNLSFYRREEVKDIVAYLKCLANPRDVVALERIYNKPKRGLGPRVWQSIQTNIEHAASENREATVIQAMEQVLEHKALAKRSLNALEQFLQTYGELEKLLDEHDTGILLLELIQEVLQRSGLLAYYTEREEQELSERCGNFDSLLEEARHYGRGRQALIAFLESIELETEELESEQTKEEQTILITMHNTKGLEFERVFVTGLELGIFPKLEALDDPQKMEEERRLFYVAITRAESELYLSAVGLRILYGNSKSYEPSPLLREIDQAFYEDCSLSQIQKQAQKQESVGNPNLAGCKQFSAAELQRQQQKTQAIQHKQADDPFVVGARVEHLDYGLGYVVQRKCSANITTLMIKLDDGRLIRLQLEFQQSKLDFIGIGI